MASAAGIWPIQKLSPAEVIFPHHNVDTSAPGLPVKAAHKIYQGVMVAYDPANSEARYADPAQAATAIVIGVNTGDTVDNTTGAKGDLKINPEAGIFRLANDGNLTAAHLFKRVRVIDDHTVGVPAGTDADRFAGILIGLEGTGYVWVLIAPNVAIRGPLTLGNANSEFSGVTLATEVSTNGTAAAAADLAALKAEAELIGDDVRDVRAKFATLVTKCEEMADDVRAALAVLGTSLPAA